ncbi:MAG TPA: hypothetical protein VML55_22120 [Planctomycetaceae bacterium]|nr:hypothetical protein [Planctomycetaceae bacterium]
MRVAWLVPILFAGGDALAQVPFGRQPPAMPADEVRRTADDILSSPEFRDFQRLRESETSSGSASGYGGDPPRSEGAPRPGMRRPPDANDQRRGSRANGERSAEQPPDGTQDAPYADGWRGGVEGGRQSVRPKAPADNAAGRSSTPSENADSSVGRSSTPSESEDSPAGRSSTPSRNEDSSAKDSEGTRSERRQDSRGDPTTGRSTPPSNRQRAEAEPGAPAENDPSQPGDSRENGPEGTRRSDQNPEAPAGERRGGSGPPLAGGSDRANGVGGGNRPFGDGWRGGEQGGRRMVERFNEGRNDQGTGGSGARRSGTGGSGRGPRESSARSGSRRSGSDSASRSSRSRHTSDGEHSAPARDDRSMQMPASGPLGSAVASLFHVLAWIFLAGVCGMIAYLIYRAIRDYEWAEQPQLAAEGGPAPAGIEPESAPGEIPADVYVARARELAQSGQYREAVAQLLLGAMSHIERGGLIRYRRGLTLRDYLRAVRRAQPQFIGMKSMVRVYEPLGFGRRDATREHFETSLAGYEQGFRSAMTNDQ